MAQKQKASMVMVVDDDPNTKNLFIIENDLNLLKQIKIPTIFISQETGMELITAMKNSSEDLVMAIDFPLVKSVDVAFINVVLTVDDF